MHQLTQASGGLGPPPYDALPFWDGFWIATVVILVVVALVGTIISLVNRVEWQAAITVMHLSEGKDASTPFEHLVETNLHLRAIARAIRAGQASAPTGSAEGGISR